MKIRIIRIPDQYKYEGELNARKWKHEDGGWLDEINNNPLFNIVKFVDPTGISSYYDVYDAGRDLYSNPSWSNAGALGIEVLGALPLIGKLGKVLKIGSKIAKGEKSIEAGTKTLDYLSTRLPSSLKDGHDMQQYRENKKAEGGPLLTQGGIFSNGVIQINEGGTHSENPFEGVQMGVDPQGIPNLVEEGEVVWNDYVFSNRLKPSKEMKKKNKYKGDTFADIAKEIQKESEERPNDWISNNGLEAGLSKLAALQEGIRERKERRNMYPDGGKLNTYNLRFTPDNWELLPEDLEELRDIKLDSPKTDNTTDTVDTSWKYSPLRYAPIVGNGLAVLSDVFSEPDYNAADRVAGVEVNPALVKYSPVGQYLTYRPLDRNYYTNQLRSNAAANRRAIMNTSGGNRAAALTGLLASDYNFGNQLGQLARQAEEYNNAQRERVAAFNRETDLANSRMGLQASTFNAESRNQATARRLAKAETVARMRQAARDAYDTRRSHNINAFLTDLGNLGREITDRNWLDFLADKGVLKVNSKGEYVVGETKKHGGKLNKKKKKGGWRYA